MSLRNNNTFPFKCRACRCVWDEPFPATMEATAFAKRVERVRCTNCDAKSDQLTVEFHRARVSTKAAKAAASGQGELNVGGEK